jgi:CDP-diacylglycerol--glycerol-3-phosphate 3-phosphatidyltransferase
MHLVFGVGAFRNANRIQPLIGLPGMTLYDLKPRFQALLRPLVRALANGGVTANQVTLAALAGSVLVGALLGYVGGQRVFLLLPAWLFARMALNAIDGMLAREFGQKSRLGAYLNELSDVVSDAALYVPFAFVAPFHPGWVMAVVGLAGLAEFAGALGPMVGAPRRYDGPFGKSDRALAFGALGLWIGVGGPLPAWLGWLMPLFTLLLVWTIVNRVRRGIGEARG